MQEYARAMIAAAAYAAITGEDVASIYSYSTSLYRNLEASFADGQIRGFDYLRNARFEGVPANLFDYRDRAYVGMTIAGGAAEGFHHGAGHHYRAELRGNVIAFYDYGAGSWFNYAV